MKVLVLVTDGVHVLDCELVPVPEGVLVLTGDGDIVDVPDSVQGDVREMVVVTVLERVRDHVWVAVTVPVVVLVVKGDREAVPEADAVLLGVREHVAVAVLERVKDNVLV